VSLAVRLPRCGDVAGAARYELGQFPWLEALSGSVRSGEIGELASSEVGGVAAGARRAPLDPVACRLAATPGPEVENPVRSLVAMAVCRRIRRRPRRPEGWFESRSEPLLWMTGPAWGLLGFSARRGGRA